jgi:hypothetical protein
MRRGVLCLVLAALAVSGCSQGPGQVSERAQFVIEPFVPVSEGRTVQDCGESCLLRTDRREDEWDCSTDGALLMANALTWVAGSEGTATPTTVLFEDTFPSTTLDAGKWTGGAGASVDDVGIDEPSGPYSLRLNGNPSGGDSVESRVIDLSSCLAAVLTYYYQETGGGASRATGRYGPGPAHDQRPACTGNGRAVEPTVEC